MTIQVSNYPIRLSPGLQSSPRFPLGRNLRVVSFDLSAKGVIPTTWVRMSIRKADTRSYYSIEGLVGSTGSFFSNLSKNINIKLIDDLGEIIVNGLNATTADINMSLNIEIETQEDV